MSNLLLDAATLMASRDTRPYLILDVRHALTDPEAGYKQFLAGHIPGAVFLRQDTDLASMPTGHNGRHPLPDPSVLSAQLAQAGLTADTQVVVYDADTGTFAARAWWLLRWLGHNKVALLDGGWRAWLEQGGEQESGPGTGAQVSRSQPAACPDTTDGLMPVVQADALSPASRAAHQLLIDARDGQRYRGEHEPIDPVAGHIPGAVNRPVDHNLTAEGRFKTAAALRDAFTDLLGQSSPDQAVHYCGSGIFACHNLFAMELAGLSGSQLYPGSWSEWCSDHDRPVATV